jgi:Tetrapyrrole (Corrin/Porphyrin) Methylases
MGDKTDGYFCPVQTTYRSHSVTPRGPRLAGLGWLKMPDGHVTRDVPLTTQRSTSRRAIRRNAPLVGRRPGSLVIIGSGIKAIGQFTLEAAAYLEWADAVYFCVADPATERWILVKRPDAVDLYTLYDNGKHRGRTYVQMAELMLRSLRQGLNVVGVFYGHPGVFVSPSHRAIAIARQEGHVALMLPAVSALDCLFADLGIDPSRPGCQILEATDVVLRRRPLMVDAHVIIFQVGSVGDAGFNFSGYTNRYLPILIRYLQDSYGNDYEVIHYIAAQFPIARPVVERLQLSCFDESSNAKKITGISTFYLPPKTHPTLDPDMADALGLPAVRAAAAAAQSRRDPFVSAPLDYTKEELAIISELDTHQVPADYKPTRPTQGMYLIMKDLALDPLTREQFASDPQQVFGRYPDLSDTDRTALLSRHYGLIRRAMQRTSKMVAEEFVRRILRDAAMAHRYRALQTLERGTATGRERIWRALLDLGYDTTPEDVSAALEEILESDLTVWSGDYETSVAGARHGVLHIDSSSVTFNGSPIEGYVFEKSVLSWMDAGDNATSALLTFKLRTDVGREPLPEGSYMGPQFQGFIWTSGSARPTTLNAFGHIGVYWDAPSQREGLGDSAAVWSGIYEMHLFNDESWVRGPEMSFMGSPDGSYKLSVDGKDVTRSAYSSGNLSWIQPAPLYSGALIFHREWANEERSAFIGRMWRGTEQVEPTVNVIGQKVRDE